MNVAFWQKLDQSARGVTPFLLSLVLVLLTVLPLPFPGFASVAPPLAVMSVYHWAIYRPSLLPVPAVFLVGLLHDLLTGVPVGLFALVFLAVYGVSLTQRRFIAGKSFLIYWLGFAIIAFGGAMLSWVLASLWHLMVLDFKAVLFQYLVSVGLFPVVAWVFLKWQQTVLS